MKFLVQKVGCVSVALYVIKVLQLAFHHQCAKLRIFIALFFVVASGEAGG